MTGFYSEIISASGAYKAFIDGEWRESTSGKTVAIANPTTEATAFTVQGTDSVLFASRFALGGRNAMRFDVREVLSGMSWGERRGIVPETVANGGGRLGVSLRDRTQLVAAF